MSALSFSSQPYGYGAHVKKSQSSGELLPGAHVKVKGGFLSEPVFGEKSITKHVGRMPPPSPLNLHPSYAAKARIIPAQTSPK